MRLSQLKSATAANGSVPRKYGRKACRSEPAQPAVPSTRQGQMQAPMPAGACGVVSAALPGESENASAAARVSRNNIALVRGFMGFPLLETDAIHGTPSAG